MKFNISKEWCEKSAKLEEGCASVEAGADPMLPPTREQWLERCAAVFRTKAAIEPVQAMQFAETQLEVLDGDLTENPEDAAESEMSYWTAE